MLTGVALLALFSGCFTQYQEERREEKIEVRDIELAQLDWYGPGGLVIADRSSWGRVSWTYDPGMSTTAYISFRAKSLEGEPVWLVKNLPLFPSESGRKGLREATFFDLAQLGYEEGQPVEALELEVGLENALKEDPKIMLGPTMIPVLRGRDMLCGNDPEEAEAAPKDAGLPGVKGPGRPDAARGDGVSRHGNEERDMGSVQEAERHCMAGAFSRSLDWLSRTHGLGLKDAQGIYEDLVAAGVSRRGNGGNEAWIRIKDEYARSQTGNRIVTKIWNSGADAGLDAVPGVTTEGPPGIDFPEWLKREMRDGEDVELAFKERGVMTGEPFRHIVTVVEVVVDRRDEVVRIKYRDDDDQGNANDGDDRVKSEQISHSEGQWHFGRRGRQITFAVSESVVPAPG